MKNAAFAVSRKTANTGLAGLIGSIVLLAFIPSLSIAGTGPITRTPYCISGSGNGTPWSWTIGTGATMLSGASAGVSGTSEDVRNEFVRSIVVAARGGSVFPYVEVDNAFTGCTAPDQGFVIKTLTSRSPLLQVTNLSGVLTTVTGPNFAAGTDFNPRIWINTPEPGMTMMLATGLLGLVSISRRRMK